MCEWDISVCDTILCLSSVNQTVRTYANEQMWRSDQEIHQGLTDLWSVMQDSIDCGLSPSQSQCIVKTQLAISY